MPRYEFVCTNWRCSRFTTPFEIWEKMDQEHKADCPACGRPARRIYGLGGISFNGPGFYCTDNRKG